MAVDTWITQTANDLLACWQEQLKANPDPPADFCVRVGESVAEDIDPITGEDQCCEGLAWVRVGNMVPSSNFPDVDTTYYKCYPVTWALELELGIMRCMPGQAQTPIVSCSNYQKAFTHDVNDLRAMEETLCCWKGTLSKGRLFAVLSAEPYGPRGGCIGRTMQLLVQKPKCC